MKQVLSYWEPLCSITLNKKDQNLNTVRALKENTYVDNLMQTGGNDEELMRFKAESTARRESARFPVHKFQARSLDMRGIKMMTHRSRLQSLSHKNIQ